MGSRSALIDGAMKSVSVVDGASAGKISGPCLIETPFWSAVVPSGWSVADTEFGLRLTR
jgi:hypothetical protein